MPLPLSGIRAIEAGGSPAIGYAGRLFADLGAEVLRVTGAHGAAPRALAQYLDSGKTCLQAELAKAAGQARLSELVTGAQVLFCGSSDSGDASRVDARALAQAHPALVVASVTPFGLNASRCGDDLTLQAYGGISIGIGLAGQPPLKLPGNQSAFQAGVSAAIAALGALLARRGALLDVATADVWAAFYSGVEVALAHFGRHGKQRAGHRVSGQPYPRTLLRCSDGYFAIQCGENRHWQSLLRMIRREDLLTHPLFANRFKANDDHGDACDALIEPWFLARTKAEILEACLEHRIPGAPVYDVREVLEHPHLRGRGYFREVETAGSRVRLPGDPYGGLTRNVRRGIATGPDSAPRDDRAGGFGACAGAACERGNADKRRPLAGVRVVDFGWVWAGAVPGHILADLGAEVIKVESASPLDYMRQGRPIVGSQKDPEQNPMFHNVNRGKLSLRIKLDHAQAPGVLKALVAKSDVVIENFSPGVMDKFGLGYGELSAVRPGLVMCSMSAVGHDGPLRGIRTYATMIASLAGLDSLVAYPGGRVLGSQSSYADPNASLHATLGILAALWRRSRTGEGAYIDLSQWEAAVNVMGEQIAQYALTGEMPEPCGTLDAQKAPHGHYPALGEDRWIAISAATDEHWAVLKARLGSPVVLESREFGTLDGRRMHRADLDRRLAELTRRRDAATLAQELARAGVPAAPLLYAGEIAQDAHFVARSLFETVEHPVLGRVPVYRLPWHLDGAPVPLTRRAPLLGEHNGYVLQSLLGYPGERIDALASAGLFV